MVDRQITIPTQALIALCQRHPILRLSLFGSVLRDDFAANSDIDVLVEFVPDSGITFLDMVTLQDELAAILGREVDLLTPDALSPYFRDRVLAAAEPVYERG